jgi:glycosyltransferase involved in cell wall biosynthesis
MVMISVIVPFHNSAAMLRRSLQGVAASTYRNFECIAVNDSSTDDAMTVAREFPFRTVELTGGPFGPAHARNQGVAVARGEIVCFVDADVVIAPDTLSKIADSFARDPELVGVFGSYDENPAASNFLSQYKNLFHYFVHQQGSERASTFWAGCGALRRDVFEQAGGFDSRRYPIPSIEDIELGVRLTAAGHKILLNKQIQAQHLKRWTFRGLLKSDILDRGIPWTLLILQQRHLPNDLNLRFSQRLSAILVVGLLLTLGLSVALQNWWWLALLPCLAALVVMLNHRFYAFYVRKRGLLFALGVFPFHLLYYLYGLLAFGLGVGLYLRNGGPRRGSVC